MTVRYLVFITSGDDVVLDGIFRTREHARGYAGGLLALSNDPVTVLAWDCPDSLPVSDQWDAAQAFAVEYVRAKA